MPRPRLLALAICSLALVPGTARAAAWTAPQPLPVPVQWWIGGLSVAADRAGDTAAAWVDTDSSGTIGTGSALRPAGGAWAPGPDAWLGGTGASVVYGRDRTVSVELHERPDDPANGVFARFGRFGVAGGSPRVRLLEGTASSDLAIAGDARGDVLIVSGTARFGASVVQAAYRPAGGRFPRLHTISKTWSRAPAVAVDEHGDAIVAWWRKYGHRGRRMVEARLLRHGRWGSIERIVSLPSSEPGLSVAAAHGTFLLGFSSNDISSGGEDAGALSGAAVRKASGHWSTRIFSRTSTGGGAAGGVRALVDARGRGTVVWNGQVAGAARMELARVPAGTIGAPVVLPSVTGAPHGFADAVMASDGRIAIAWTERDQSIPTSPAPLVVATLGTGAAARPEVATVASGTPPVSSARLAFLPSSGMLTAVWSQGEPGGTGMRMYAADLLSG